MLIHQNNQILKFEVFILILLPTGQNNFETDGFFERDLQPSLCITFSYSFSNHDPFSGPHDSLKSYDSNFLAALPFWI